MISTGAAASSADAVADADRDADAGATVGSRKFGAHSIGLNSKANLAA